MESNNTTLNCGIKLRNLRKQLGLSQENFGRVFGLSGMTIHNYEIGKFRLPLYLFEIIDNLGGNSQYIKGKSKRAFNSIDFLVNACEKVNKILKN